MKLMTKQKLLQTRLKVDKEQPQEGTYWCRRCGVEGNGFALCTETTYSNVNIQFIFNEDVEYGDDWNTTDSDNHHTYAYECGVCSWRREKVEEVFTSILSTPLIARITMLRMLAEKSMEWQARRTMWQGLEPITPEQEKGQEVKYNAKTYR